MALQSGSAGPGLTIPPPPPPYRDDSLSSLFDHRIVNRPKPIGNNRAEWRDWKFEVANFMCMVHAQYTDDLRVAELERTPVDDTADTELRRRSTLLYAILASITKERAKQIVIANERTRNGYEVWRQLVQEYEPHGTSRRLHMLRELCKATQLQGKTEANYHAALLAWEREIDEYDRMPADTPGGQPSLFHEAAIMDTAPDSLRTHLSLLPITTTHGQLRVVIETYLRAKGTWTL